MIPNLYGKFSKNLVHLQKKGGNEDILGLNINGEIVTDESVLAEVFNDYFEILHLI